MKKLLFLIVVLFVVLPIAAQDFWTGSDVNVSVKYWHSQSDINYLLENGTKLQMTIFPSLSWHGTNIVGPTVVNYMFYHKDKFFRIGIYKEYSHTYICLGEDVGSGEINNDITDYFLNNPEVNSWAKIDFGNVVFYEPFNYVMIPFGDDGQGKYYSICISFNNPSEDIKSVKSQDSDMDQNMHTKYFNLAGVEVSKDSYKGILIESNGKRTKKILNK